MRTSFSIAKVRIFIDFWNFSRNWQHLTGSLPEDNLDWAALPIAILEHLDAIPHMRNIRKELRSVKVFASVKPIEYFQKDGISKNEIEDERRLQKWLQDDLDQLTSYTVDITANSNRSIRCDVCESETDLFFEQGVDTKIAIDLVSLASRDLYDIAVLVTDDHDLVPSTQCVQDALDKQIVHLGFKDQKTDVRLEAWGHLFIDDMLSSIVR
jgi:hypothetical protein